MGLTTKQKEFAELITHNLSGAEAARRAGYSPNAARAIAAETLTNPNVKALVEQKMAARANRLEITGDDIVEQLWSIATNEKNQTGPRVAALMGVSKLLGLLEDKIRITDNKPNFEGFIEQLHKEKRFDRVDGKIIEVNPGGSDGKTQA